MLAQLPPRFAELDVILEGRGTRNVEQILEVLQREGFPARLR